MYFCVSGYEVVHWCVVHLPVAMFLKETSFLSSISCQPSASSQLWGGISSFPLQSGISTGLILCRGPQMLWVTSSGILPYWKYTSALSNLWLLQSSHLHLLQWSLSLEGGYRCPFCGWIPPHILTRTFCILIVCEFLHSLTSTAWRTFSDAVWELDSGGLRSPIRECHRRLTFLPYSTPHQQHWW